MACRVACRGDHAAGSSHQHRAAAQPATPLLRRRSALLLTLSVPLALRPDVACALGLESSPLPQIALPRSAVALGASGSAVEKAEAAFRDSDLLRALRERSDMNREENARKIADKYCRRQAELGVGDCAGLQLIPGMTKSGLQKDPQKPWERQLLENVLGVFSQKSDASAGGD